MRGGVSIGAASSLGWERYGGWTGVDIGLDRFGASAPAAELYRRFGLTAQRVVDEATRLLEVKVK